MTKLQIITNEFGNRLGGNRQVNVEENGLTILNSTSCPFRPIVIAFCIRNPKCLIHQVRLIKIPRMKHWLDVCQLRSSDAF